MKSHIIGSSSKRWPLDACDNHFEAVTWQVSFWVPFIKKESNVQWPLRANKINVTCCKSTEE